MSLAFLRIVARACGAIFQNLWQQNRRRTNDRPLLGAFVLIGRQGDRQSVPVMNRDEEESRGATTGRGFMGASLSQLGLAPQQMVIVLGKTVRLVADVLQQPKGIAVPAQT